MTRGLQLELSGNTANAAQTLCTVAWQFQDGNLRFVGTANANANHVAAPVDVSTDGLVDIGAHGGQALGKFWRGNSVDR